MPGPLSHLTVLDLSRVLAGPWCTQLLADLGATVIKIERPGTGDDTRAWGPPYLKDAEGRDTSEAAYYLCCNRGKLSVAVDFTTPDGQNIIRDLARQADVLVENYKVGGLAKYGLDYASIAALNPRLVYCSITGFGQNGPYADRAGYDFIIQGMSGFMSVTGERDDLPGGGPQKAGVAISDLMTGMYATVAIQAALAHRDRTGQRTMDRQFALRLRGRDDGDDVAQLSRHRDAASRIGNAHQNIVPYNVFACEDGHLILAVGNDSQFAKFCAIAGKPEWATDPRFAKNADRVRNRDDAGSADRGGRTNENPEGVARRARAARHPVWSDQSDGPGLRGSANRRAWNAQGAASSARGNRPASSRAPRIFRDAACVRPSAAVAGRAHRGWSCATGSACRTTRSPRSPRAT